MIRPGHVVVAGGAGFLGSHVCDRLIERGDTVTCLDDLSTGHIDNVRHLDASGRFRLVRGDVVDAASLDIADVTAVMHLASPASPPEYLRRPLDTLMANSVGTHQLLEVARRHDARFFLASTSEVYGDPLVHPQPESYWGNVNPNGERSVYDEAKRFSESITMTYHRTYGVDVRIARIFNTYGPRMQPDDGRVVTNFIHQALAGRPITIYGDGSQTRSFCYVDDEVDGFISLLDSEYVGPVNIGNPDEFTMHELARVVMELIDTTSEIVFEPLPSDDPRVRKPDISLAAETLGWTPTIGLRDGLTKTIEWFRS
ncbi:MAG: UDP-glucuronic acid decarboxylase family protein [Ilumatobacteraceae bacterium]|nr:UDP-glucuronic acid decarboxylase family protein [Ilumatobacteraceae bacterium]